MRRFLPVLTLLAAACGTSSPSVPVFAPSGDAAIDGGGDVAGGDAVAPPDGATATGEDATAADTAQEDAAPPDGGEADAADAATTTDSEAAETAGEDVAETPDVGPDAPAEDVAAPDAVPQDVAPQDVPPTPDVVGPDTAPQCQQAGDCDDGQPCTTDTCAGGKCVHTPLDKCQPPLVPCDANNPCAQGVCDPGKNACVQCLKTADCGGPGLLCLHQQCKPAQQCKSDIDCKALKQVCSKTDSVCVDCTTTADCGTDQACVESQCVAAKPCKSSKDCDQVCNQAKGVCVECLTSDDCAAGQYCTGLNRCAAAICAASGSGCGSQQFVFECKTDGSGYKPGASCEDGNVCTDHVCTAAKGCEQGANTKACDDGSACTQADVCSGGKCAGTSVKCDDVNPCTDDSCDAKAGCKHANNTVKCDDGTNCTSDDVCLLGVCKGKGVDCDDGNPCTDDSCDAKQACVHTAKAGPCTDGSACTEGDVCEAGKCKAGATKVCNDQNPCTADSCDPAKGCVASPLNTGSCDDANACTFSDTCSAGACVGQPGKCADDNPCTDDQCDPKTGCKFPANTAVCSDGNACTDKDACASGKCVGGGTTNCDDGNACTDEACDPAKNGCFFSSNSAVCNDGTACTVGDKCGNGKCTAGAPLDCDDNNKCTVDTCDSVKGCVHAPNLALCNDGQPCTTDTCNPATGTCTNVAVPGCCTNGLVLYGWNFDTGVPEGTTFQNSTGLAKKGWQIWDPADDSKSPKGVLYYGDPFYKNYNFTASTSNSGVVTLPEVTLPAQGKKRLKAQVRIDIEKYADYDTLVLAVTPTGQGDVTLWTKKNLGTYSCNTSYTCVNMPPGWFTVDVEIPASVVGKVRVKAIFNTVDHQYNSTLGVLVDDLEIVQNCQ